MLSSFLIYKSTFGFPWSVNGCEMSLPKGTSIYVK